MSTELLDEQDRLRALIGELQERIFRLRHFDKSCEINAHCDDLVGQIMITVESAVENLNKMQDSMIKEINQYRDGLLGAAPGKEEALEKELDELATEIEAFNSKAVGYLTQKKKLADAIQEADDLNMRAQELKKQMRVQSFDGVFLRFLDNKKLFDSFSIGVLQKSLKDPEEEMALKHVILDELVPNANAFDVSSSKSSSSDFHPIVAILYLQDGQLAISRWNRTILIWNLEDARKNFELKFGPSTETISALAQLPHGQLVGADSDGIIHIWDLTTKKHVKSLGQPGKEVLYLRVLRDGSLAAFNDNIRVWSPSVLNGPSQPTTKAQAEGRLKIEVVDPMDYYEEFREFNQQPEELYLNQQIVFEFDEFELDDEIDDPRNYGFDGISFRANFEILENGDLAHCLILPNGVTFKLHSSKDGKLIKEIHLPGKNITSCTLLPSGDAVVCRTDKIVEVYSLKDGKVFQSFKNENGPIVAIKQQSKNQLIFVHLQDSKLPILVMDKKKRSNKIPYIRSSCFSEDGQTLAVGSFQERFVVFPLRKQ